MTADSNRVEELLAKHKEALQEYTAWDQEVKSLLKGRRHNELSDEEIKKYRDVAASRDLAYDRMRHLERQLLSAIPDADTGEFPALEI